MGNKKKIITLDHLRKLAELFPNCTILELVEWLELEAENK